MNDLVILFIAFNATSLVIDIANRQLRYLPLSLLITLAFTLIYGFAQILAFLT